MGTFQVEMAVANPESGASRSVQAVVDTGATLTTLPLSLAEDLGLHQEDTAVVQLGDGTVRQLGVSTARLTVQGRTRTTSVLFSPGGSPPLLGAVSLEAMGFAVDPVGRRLVPQALLLLRLDIPS